MAKEKTDMSNRFAPTRFVRPRRNLVLWIASVALVLLLLTGAQVLIDHAAGYAVALQNFPKGG